MSPGSAKALESNAQTTYANANK